MDGIALVMLMLIAILVPLVILASWHDAEASKRSVPAYFALLLVLECTMIGVFAAADVFLFYVFFEVMLVPMYFLIGSYGGHQRQYAAVKFFLYSLVGGLFMLAAVIGLWVVGGKTFDWQALTPGGRSPRTRPAGCSSASSSPSRSRRRSSRSTPGCPTPVARPRPARPRCWSACWTRSARSASCATACRCSRRRRASSRRGRWRSA